MTLTSSGHPRNNRKKPGISLSSEDLKGLVEAISIQGDGNIVSIGSLEEYLNWYLNIYGQIALESFIEDCKKAIKEKDYKKLLEAVSTLQANHRAQLSTSIKSPSRENAQIAPEMLNDILEEYEVYFNELEIDAIVLEENVRDLDEGGYISFGEIKELVSTIEKRINELVATGEITEEQAQELLTELKDIEVGKFSNLTKEELETLATELPLQDIEQIQQKIQTIESLENIELNQSSLRFGEEGFLNLDTDAFDSIGKNAHLSFAEMEEKSREFEEELIELVEKGVITSDEAYELRDKFVDSPVEQALDVQETELQAIVRETELPETVQEIQTDEIDQVVVQGGIQQEPAIEGDFQDLDFEPTTEPSIDVSQIDEPVLSDDFEPAPTPLVAEPALKVEPVTPTTQEQQLPIENFVPVTLFTPGTRPAENPTYIPTQNTDLAPNLVAQPQSFAKPDVPARPAEQQAETARKFQATQSQVRYDQTEIAEQQAETARKFHLTQTQVRYDQTDIAEQQAETARKFQLTQSQVQIDQTQQNQQPQGRDQQPQQPQEQYRQDQYQQDLDQITKDPTGGPKDRNDPKETDFKKGPCAECNEMSCEKCNARPNAEHLEGAMAQKFASRQAGTPAIAPPIVADSFGSDFQSNVAARSIEPRALVNSGLGR